MGTIVYAPVKRRNPLDASVKYYPQRVGAERLTTDDVIDYIAQNSQLPRASVPAAVSAILKTITNFVLNGHSVQLPRLGIFSATLQDPDAAAETAAEVRVTKNARIMIRFRAASSLQQELKYGISYKSVQEVGSQP